MKPYEIFLQKIGVVLPTPRRMEGFGMELPDVYVERCLEVIVPATEEFIRKQVEAQQQLVIDDFMKYVQNYKGYTGEGEAKSSTSPAYAKQVVSDVTEGINESLKKLFPFRIINKTEASDTEDTVKATEETETNDVEDTEEEDAEEESSDGKLRTSLKRADQYNAVHDFFTKYPLATRDDCIQSLGISMNTLGRRLRDLYFDKGFCPVNAGYKPRGMDDEKTQKDLQILRDYIAEHPNAYKLDFMRNLKLRRDELDIYLRILSKEGIYTERSVKRDVSMPIDTNKTNDSVSTKEEIIDNIPVEKVVETTKEKPATVEEKQLPIKEKEEANEIKVKPVAEVKPKKVSNHNMKEIFKYENPSATKPSYKEGGYMAGIRRRFEASSRSSVKPTLTDVSNIVLKEYFDSLPSDVKNRAIMEHWDSANADYDAISKLDSKFSDVGLHLSKNKLTKLECAMLTDVAKKKDVSINDLLMRYGNYVTK